jgi:hypothetical protein
MTSWMGKGKSLTFFYSVIYGQGYQPHRAETVYKAEWSADSVHPIAHTFARMALILFEKARESLVSDIPAGGWENR